MWDATTRWTTGHWQATIGWTEDIWNNVDTLAQTLVDTLEQAGNIALESREQVGRTAVDTLNSTANTMVNRFNDTLIRRLIESTEQPTPPLIGLEILENLLVFYTSTSVGPCTSRGVFGIANSATPYEIEDRWQ